MRIEAGIDKAALLRRVSILAGIDRVPLARLAASLEPRRVAPGEEICRAARGIY